MKLEGHIIAVEVKGMLYYFDYENVIEEGVVARFTSNINQASLFSSLEEAESQVERLQIVSDRKRLRNLYFSESMYANSSVLIWDLEDRIGVEVIKVLEVKRSVKTKIVGDNIKS